MGEGLNGARWARQIDTAKDRVGAGISKACANWRAAIQEGSRVIP